MRRLWIGCWMLAAAAMVPLRADEVPQALAGWQDWVLHDVPDHACPLVATPGAGPRARVCAWPGSLALDASAGGARFSLDARADAETWIPLPGNRAVWPAEVLLDGKPAAVLQRDDTPVLLLQPGDHRVQGMLPWASRPPRLTVPSAIGLVRLSLDGRDVVHLERHGDQLTLGEATAGEHAADALDMRVYRHLQDGLPPTLDTRVELVVAGSAREVTFGPVLPEGFVATAVAGDLPARLEKDGRLRIQVRPGDWTLDLAARGTAPLAGIRPPAAPAPWPAHEVWSYEEPAGNYRGTRVEGQATDAQQAGVPDDWSRFPAFAVGARAGLAVRTMYRGVSQGDRLRLDRELWLDMDGQGLTAVDHLQGMLHRHRRLEVASPWRLSSARVDDAPRLLTRGPQGADGVELETHAADLTAILRLPRTVGAIPAGGWQATLEHAGMLLHLPRGYRLFAAPGTDRSPDAWIAGWNLLDLFVLALIGLLAGRLLGWRWMPVAFGFLVLAHHEGGPRWTLAGAMAFGLLLRALPTGRLRTVAHGGAWVLLMLAVAWTLPFAGAQLEYALHPQLEPGTSAVASASVPRVGFRSAASKREPAPPPVPLAAPRADELSSVQVSASELKSLGTLPPPAEPSAGIVVQAGTGQPTWDQQNNYRLAWSGPVAPEQTLRLWLVPAWLVRLLRVAMVALLAIWLGRLGGTLGGSPKAGGWRLPWRGVAAACLLVLALPGTGHAQATPDQALLEQLRHRMTEPPACQPRCAALGGARLKVQGNALDVVLEAHAGAALALPLPRPGEGLVLQDVRLDGRAGPVLAHRGTDLLLSVPRGVHAAALRYAIDEDADSVSLGFPLPPHRAVLEGAGWALGGVDHGRVLGDSIELHRRVAVEAGPAAAPVASVPPYVHLTRTLRLGVDWTVENVAERVAPSQGGFTVNLPLLPGEHPNGADALVQDGRIRVTFDAGTGAVRWNSKLDRAARLVLTAPPLGERAETWAIETAPWLHVEATGVPPTDAVDLAFDPLPGERLGVDVMQPPVAPGDSVAFDRATLTAAVGERSTDATLELRGRSTRGAEQAIALPNGSELVEVRRDGQALDLAARSGRVILPLRPGAHDYRLQVRHPGGAPLLTRSLDFRMGAPVANIDLSLQLPRDRWVLWTWGPSTGPAVLYWSQLAVLLGVAWLLARFAPTPLRYRHWLLLGLGFSAFAWGAFAVVAAWLVAMGWRAREPLPERWSAIGANLLQATLAMLTAVAVAMLVIAVPQGLLGVPDMHVAGNGSAAWNLRWFADRASGALPVAGAFSLPLWVYKAAMFAWALWLANALIGWLRWSFQAWSLGGYWRRREAPRSGVPGLPAQGEGSTDA